jgi:hypothetical protein
LLKNFKEVCMADYSGELERPDCTEAPGATEILRVWVADGKLQVSIRAGVIDNPITWGEILADLALYADLALNEQTTAGIGANIGSIRGAFNLRLDQSVLGQAELG